MHIDTFKGRPGTFTLCVLFGLRKSVDTLTSQRENGGVMVGRSRFDACAFKSWGPFIPFIVIKQLSRFAAPS
jgi:hypothetical protein